MMCHNIRFNGVMWKNIPKLSILPLLILSTAYIAIKTKRHIYCLQRSCSVLFTKRTTLNTELNDLSKIICLRKTLVSVERISVYKVIENLVEHGRHFVCLSFSTKFSETLYCLPCLYTNDIINLLP